MGTKIARPPRGDLPGYRFRIAVWLALRTIVSWLDERVAEEE